MPRLLNIKPRSATKSEKEIGWKLLVVDDDKDVLKITEHVLKEFEFQGKSIELLFARSFSEAKSCYQQNPDIAVALVDVIMETDQAGLDFVRYIREEVKNSEIQLILRTGQPGENPERKVLVEYEINDYLSKSEVTSIKLYHRVISYIRAYDQLSEINRQKLSLEKLLHEKEHLISIVAHELRTPINAIAGIASIVLDDSTAKISEYSEEIELISASSDRMVYLISDLMDDFSSRRGELKIDLKCSNFSSLIDRIIPVFQAQRKLHTNENIVIHCDLDPDLPPLLMDDSRIEQVLINLVSNAIKYGKAKPITIRAEVDGPMSVISVIDEGIGIEEKNLSRVFDAYSQMEKLGDSDSYRGGVGLGLSIVKKIVELHNGKVGVESGLGTGSRFWFSLPLAQ